MKNLGLFPQADHTSVTNTAGWEEVGLEAAGGQCDSVPGDRGVEHTA